LGQFGAQSGDTEPEPFSFLTEAIRTPQVDCFITHTTPEGHAIIADNLGESPVYSGAISGLGPRYCPRSRTRLCGSRSARRIRFSRAEGLDDDTVYPNGISTALPEDIQEKFVRTIPGLSNARSCGPAMRSNMISSIRAACTRASRQNKSKGFSCRQINGTTGYEEAGAQGLVAGSMPLCGRSQGHDHFQPRRRLSGCHDRRSGDESVSEPYRMFTSRANIAFRCAPTMPISGSPGEHRARLR